MAMFVELMAGALAARIGISIDGYDGQIGNHLASRIGISIDGQMAMSVEPTGSRLASRIWDFNGWRCWARAQGETLLDSGIGISYGLRNWDLDR
ncbi:unnamed protein product [Sphagnum troendelagicum]|uniref:Uncharacterized protein n=1 Tax=Sphagnum troendelagicum TaxID=128251 RepID=A0ABP0UZY7_9BRYO